LFFDGYLLADLTLDDYHLAGCCVGIVAVENRKRLGCYSLGYIGYVVVEGDIDADVDLADFDMNIALVVVVVVVGVGVGAVGQNPFGIRSMTDYKIASVVVVVVVVENYSSS